MGRKEAALIDYYDNIERFAQLANGWLFDGEKYLKPEDFEDADRRQEHKNELSGDVRKGIQLRHRFRDLYKCTKELGTRLLIGTELQEKVDYSMPLRVIDMDVLAYLRQKKKISGSHVPEDYSRPGEYLSQFTRSDRLIPVTTLVLYLGESPWDGARSLHELLDFGNLPDRIQEYVENYRIHVLDVRHTPDEAFLKFPRDIRFMLLFIKYTKDKEALARLKDLCGQEAIGRDTFEALAAYVNEPALLEWEEDMEENEEGDEVNMCEGIRALVADGEERGRNQGEERVNHLIVFLLEKERMADIRRAVTDKKYQEKLFAEFNL